jgi:polar amino acid transport system ATP-binding protein
VSAPVLEVRGVTKAWGTNEVLRGVDLSVAEHQAVAIIGASGSGKSTLLRCVDLLVEIDDGDIFLDGEVITDPAVDPVPVRRRLGLVFQAYNLFPHLTALQNIVLGDRFAHGASKEEALERARALLARFGLEGREAERPEDLSGGQQQRVAIARAFAGRPRAMLLDEVTSALDPELVGEVLEAVRDLKHEGVTVLIATHEMSFAREVADLVGFLHDGRIIELGPPDQVLTDPERPETNAVPAAPARGGEDLVRLCQPGASCSAPASAFSRSG